MRLASSTMQTRTNGFVWFAAALTGIAAACVFAVSPRAAPGSTANSALQLDATEAGGHIRISWNPEDMQVKRSTAATLEVRDGSRYEIYPVNGDSLRHGSLDYVHQSGDVLLTLTLFEDGTPGSKGMLRAISALAPEARMMAPDSAQRSRMKAKKGKASSYKRRQRARRR